MIEYKIVAALSPLSEEQMNDYGKDWWALITIMIFEDVYWHYFSRLAGTTGAV